MNDLSATKKVVLSSIEFTQWMLSMPPENAANHPADGSLHAEEPSAFVASAAAEQGFFNNVREDKWRPAT
jgi:hypothetical protein